MNVEHAINIGNFRLLNNKSVYAFSIIVSAILFSFDLIAPLGIAFGVSYLLIMFISYLASNSKFIIIVATTSSILIILGYFLSPVVGTFDWIVLINRFIALLVIWSTALLLYYRKAEKTKLSNSENKYRTLIELAPIGIHQLDSNLNLVSINKAGLKLFNETNEQVVIGKPFLQNVCENHQQRVSSQMDEGYNGKLSEFEFMCTQGKEYFCSFVPLQINDQSTDHMLGVTLDISKQKKAEVKLKYQAQHDILTGLINRFQFEDIVTKLLLSIGQQETEHAMCYLDLDQFKIINDTCGHTAGDELLRQIGTLLKKHIRKQDTLARLGGDEFAILMNISPLDIAKKKAEEILQAIKEFHFSWGGKTFRIGVSIGLVTINETTGNLTELFQQAEAACYFAKDQGRNRIHTYQIDDSMLEQRHGEMQWVGRINQALEANQFCLYAQPIVELDNGELKHYELLLRMLDEQNKIIPPGFFLPAAERFNLIEKLDTWVVKHAFKFLSENPSFVDKINFVSINLSGPSLTKKEFLEFILQQFKDFKISPDKICFEITETVAVSNLDSASSFISILKLIGCHFALDDFGSGFSSLGYLKNLPVNYLKIDGVFVKDIVNDKIDCAMVKSINDIGHIMGMKTIAEYVENDEIKDILKSIGVDYAQGYGLGKPVPLDEIIK